MAQWGTRGGEIGLAAPEDYGAEIEMVFIDKTEGS
jgi:hypothetical protein